MTYMGNYMMKADIFITRGNIEILNQRKIAIFSSKLTPKELYTSIESIFQKLRNQNIAIASGWQAPLEKNLFKKIDHGDKANYIYYLAKDLNQKKFDKMEDDLVAQNKLLFLSPNLQKNRITKSLVTERDELLFSQNNKVLFFYISDGGRLEGYFNKLSEQHYQIYILDHPLNQRFFTKDVIPVDEENINIIFTT